MSPHGSESWTTSSAGFARQFVQGRVPPGADPNSGGDVLVIFGPLETPLDVGGGPVESRHHHRPRHTRSRRRGHPPRDRNFRRRTAAPAPPNPADSGEIPSPSFIASPSTPRSGLSRDAVHRRATIRYAYLRAPVNVGGTCAHLIMQGRRVPTGRSPTGREDSSSLFQARASALPKVADRATEIPPESTCGRVPICWSDRRGSDPTSSNERLPEGGTGFLGAPGAGRVRRSIIPSPSSPSAEPVRRRPSARRERHRGCAAAGRRRPAPRPARWRRRSGTRSSDRSCCRRCCPSAR